MELKPGMSALVTGGANGIGKAIALALAKNGIFVTILDFSEERGNEAVSLLQTENKKFHPDINFPSAMFIQCDVTKSGDVTTAFEKHVETYGGSLDICVNSAGVGCTVKRFDEDETDAINTWRRIISINFVAVVDCTRIAIQTMRKTKRPGVIVNLGSASGLYPMRADPIYSATKGGVVLFSRSCGSLVSEGIRVNVLCPEFVDTDMISDVNLGDVNLVGGYLSLETVVKGALELIKDESKAGACLWITKRRGSEYWPIPEEEKKIYQGLIINENNESVESNNYEESHALLFI